MKRKKERGKEEERGIWGRERQNKKETKERENERDLRSNDVTRDGETRGALYTRLITTRSGDDRRQRERERKGEKKLTPERKLKG